MSYLTAQESAEFGSPVQLFKFVYGTQPGEFYAYTDAVDPITLNPGTADEITYVPGPITRDGISASGTLDKSTLKISVDVSTDLAELFRVYPPSSVVTLVIREGHIGDVDEQFLVTWAGRIVSADRDHSEMIMAGEPISTSMRRPGLRANYQYGCRHALYGPNCRADKASKTLSTTLMAIAGATVTLAAGWEGAFPPDKFLGGLLEWSAGGGSTQQRTILRVTGDVLSLSGLVQGLVIGDAVNVVLGCNHQAFAASDGDCQALHDNIENFGGCPWIPLMNPIGTFNNYY